MPFCKSSRLHYICCLLRPLHHPFFRQSTKSHAAKLPITLFLQPPPPLRKGRMNDAHCIDTKLFPRPPSLLMSNASSIDLLVDLKEIQSQMPQVAFFPLWEIKRFNSPCLSTLIIIISPSSPFVCLLRRLPLPWTPPNPNPNPTPLAVTLSSPRPRSLTKFSGSFANLLFVFPVQTPGERGGGEQPCR